MRVLYVITLLYKAFK